MPADPRFDPPRPDPLGDPGLRGSVGPTALDHVALWVSDPDALAEPLCRGLGMHVIERTDAFTLVGVDARLGKLTLFAAPGPRDPGVLDRVVLRVADVRSVIEQLPPELGVREASDAGALLEAPEGLAIGLVPGRPDQVPYDLDHVILRVPDADRSAPGWASSAATGASRLATATCA